MRLKGAVEARRVRDRLCRSDIFSVNTNRTFSRFVVRFTPRSYSLHHSSCSFGSISLFNSRVKVRVYRIIPLEFLFPRRQKIRNNSFAWTERSVTETMPRISLSSRRGWSKRENAREMYEKGWKNEERRRSLISEETGQ